MKHKKHLHSVLLHKKSLLLSFLLCSVVLCGAGLYCSAKPPLLDLPFSVHIVDSRGESLRLSMAEDSIFRLYVPLEEIPPELQKATLLYEDRYFFVHWGVNPVSLLRGAFSLTGLSHRMGGSTLTMQVARMRYGLETGSVGGKIQQILYSLLLERHYSKNEILEAYFNLAPYGGNIEGIGAAARIYFKKSPIHLALPEMLALVGIPQNPVQRNPLRLNNHAFDEARARVSALWFARYGSAMTDSEQALFRAPHALRIYGPAALPFKSPHLCDELLAQRVPLLSNPGSAAPSDLPAFQRSWRHKPEKIFSDMSRNPASPQYTKFKKNTVHTFIHSKLQQHMEQSIARYVARRAGFGVSNAAALLVHWPTMEVRALAGSASFHNLAIQGQIDGTNARRSPGSTLKPFIYALALDQGLIHSQSLLADSPHSFGEYNPENFDQSFHGPVNARRALLSSRNIPAISLAEKLQAPDLYTFLQRAEVGLPFSREHYGLSLVLGGAEIKMRELASLYAMLANQGLWQTLRLENMQKRQEPKRLLSPEAAFVTTMMLCTEQNMLRPDLPLYLKTGTSNGFRDAWTAGIFGPYVLVVWLGNFNNIPNPVFVGADLAVPLWKEIASKIAHCAPPGGVTDSIQKRAAALNVKELEVCEESGDIDTSLCTQRTLAWFIPGVSPFKSTGIYREILLDRASGLRACVGGPNIKKVVWEFWPSDLQRIFALAGIYKASPPPFMPMCADQAEQEGQGPRILIPKSRVIYQISNKKKSSIPLTASTGAEAEYIYWFADTRFIGKSHPDEACLWTPEPGKVTLQAVDSLGRSTARIVNVETQQ